MKIIRIFLAAILISTGLGLLNCANAAGKLPPHIVIFFTADTHNELYMCGCRGERIGGVARRKTIISNTKDYPKVVVEVGGFSGGSSQFEKLKTKTLLKSYNNIGYSVINIGNTEYRLGQEVLKEYDNYADAPFISANVADANGKLVYPPYKIINVNGIRLGFLGVTSSQFIKDEVKNGFRVLDIEKQVQKYIPEVGRQSDFIILLADARDNEIEKLGTRNPDIDIILGALTFTYPENDRPTKLGNTIVHKNGDRGKYLGRLRLDLVQGSSSKIKSYEGFNQKLGPDVPDDPAIVKILDDYKKTLKSTDFTKEQGVTTQDNKGEKPQGADIKSDEMLEGEVPAHLSFSGAKRCAECHSGIFENWSHTAHAKAWETLRKEKEQDNPECLQCHTVGYMRMGGFVDFQTTPALIDVQCESCHGAGAAHVINMVKDKKGNKAITSRVPEFFCMKCHNSDWDPGFNMKIKLPLVDHGPEKKNTDVKKLTEPAKNNTLQTPKPK